MNFHFKLHRAKGGYYFDDDYFLQPTKWFEEKQTEEVIYAGEIHKKFLEILHPYHDLCAKKKAPVNFQLMMELLDWKSDIYNPQLENQFKEKIIEFANEYGLGVGDPETGSPESINPDNSLEGRIDEPHGKGQRPNLYNILAKAIEINRIILDRKSYETIPPKLKNICNISPPIPRINGGMYMETFSIWTMMYWGMAFTEFTYKVKECEYCSAPILSDQRARFCKPPRQCKNRFNNARRPTKKERKV